MTTYEELRNSVKCSNCKGKGYTMYSICPGIVIPDKIDCKNCKGKGYIPK